MFSVANVDSKGKKTLIFNQRYLALLSLEELSLRSTDGEEKSSGKKSRLEKHIKGTRLNTSQKSFNKAETFLLCCTYKVHTSRKSIIIFLPHRLCA